MITLSTEYKKDGGCKERKIFVFLRLYKVTFAPLCVMQLHMHLAHLHDLYFNVFFSLSLINIMNIAVYAAFGTNF